MILFLFFEIGDSFFWGGKFRGWGLTPKNIFQHRWQRGERGHKGKK